MRLWDYSGRRFQAGGYICLAAAAAWGSLGIFVIKFLNPLLVELLKKIPYLPGIIALAGLCLILAVDVIMTVGALFQMKNRNQAMSEIAEGLNQASRSLQGVIVGLVDRRINRVFPGMEQKKAETEEEKQELIRQKTVFAYGCSFYKVVWIFFLGVFPGALVEMVFCRFTMGWWMSRSSLVYGTFSLVWGLAAWVWMKRLYPLVSRRIEKVPVKAGKILTWAFLVFMVWDVGISGLALARYGERAQGIPPEHELAVWLDREFPDERMDEIYPVGLQWRNWAGSGKAEVCPGIKTTDEWRRKWKQKSISVRKKEWL